MEEVWMPVLDYDGFYEVSNLGRVKSFKNGKEKILNGGVDRLGYHSVVLSKNGQNKQIRTHRLVYETFLGKTDLEIDHIIEGNKLDNRLCNLQAVTGRENTSKYHLSNKKSSKYTGVNWHKYSKKWVSRIRINGKHKNLGYFTDEIEASNAYQQELLKLNQ